MTWKHASIALLLLTGCANETPPPARGWSVPVVPEPNPAPRTFDDGPAPSCTPGKSKTCVIELSSHGNAKHCVEGVQSCGEDGTWSPCDAADDPKKEKEEKEEDGDDIPV